jgi:hypothetical protein
MPQRRLLGPHHLITLLTRESVTFVRNSGGAKTIHRRIATTAKAMPTL